MEAVLLLPLLLGVCSAQENFLDELSGGALLGIAGAAVFACIGGCGLVFYCGIRAGRKREDKEAHNLLTVDETGVDSELEGSRAIRVTGSFLPNDVAPAEKEKKSKHKAKSKSPVYEREDLDSNDLSSSVSNSKSALDTVTKLTSKEARRQKGLSYGRLNPEQAERISSVRLMAEEMNMVIVPTKQKLMNSNKTNEVDVNLENGLPPEASTRDPKEDVKERVKRLAAAAGGGVYNTGASTARLSMQLVDGFHSLKEKREQAIKDREERLNNNNNSNPNSSPTNNNFGNNNNFNASEVGSNSQSQVSRNKKFSPKPPSSVGAGGDNNNQNNNNKYENDAGSMLSRNKKKKEDPGSKLREFMNSANEKPPPLPAEFNDSDVEDLI